MYTNAQYEAQKEHLRDIYRDTQNYQQAQEAQPTQRNLASRVGMWLNNLWQHHPHLSIRPVSSCPEVPVVSLSETSD